MITQEDEVTTFAYENTTHFVQIQPAKKAKKRKTDGLPVAQVAVSMVFFEQGE